jgi:hypothetical protein
MICSTQSCRSSSRPWWLRCRRSAACSRCRMCSWSRCCPLRCCVPRRAGTRGSGLWRSRTASTASSCTHQHTWCTRQCRWRLPDRARFRCSRPVCSRWPQSTPYKMHQTRNSWSICLASLRRSPTCSFPYHTLAATNTPRTAAAVPRESAASYSRPYTRPPRSHLHRTPCNLIRSLTLCTQHSQQHSRVRRSSSTFSPLRPSTQFGSDSDCRKRGARAQTVMFCS